MNRRCIIKFVIQIWIQPYLLHTILTLNKVYYHVLRNNLVTSKTCHVSFEDLQGRGMRSITYIHHFNTYRHYICGGLSVHGPKIVHWWTSSFWSEPVTLVWSPTQVLHMTFCFKRGIAHHDSTHNGHLVNERRTPHFIPKLGQRGWRWPSSSSSSSSSSNSLSRSIMYFEVHY